MHSRLLFVRLLFGAASSGARCFAMKRRLLTLAALTPVIVAPVLMTAAEQPAPEADLELTAPLQLASRSTIVTPATSLPADPTDLDIPNLDDLEVADQAAEAPHVATLRDHISRLEASLTKLSTIDSYTAKLLKQERVDGVLNPAEVTQIKVRHEAFSVYMKWSVGDRGREVLYVDGEHENQMLVHPGGWKGRFLPTLSVDPHGSLASSQSRHAITEAGLKNLLIKHLEHRELDLHGEGITASTTAATFDDRPVTQLEVSYSDQKHNPVYSRTVLMIDDELGLPVASMNFGWTAIDRDGDEATLIERYEYRDLDTATKLSSADFDRGNKAYNFR